MHHQSIPTASQPANRARCFTCIVDACAVLRRTGVLYWQAEEHESARPRARARSSAPLLLLLLPAAALAPPGGRFTVAPQSCQGGAAAAAAGRNLSPAPPWMARASSSSSSPPFDDRVNSPLHRWRGRTIIRRACAFSTGLRSRAARPRASWAWAWAWANLLRLRRLWRRAFPEMVVV